MAKITWSFEAIEDLKLIYEYISLDSEINANKMVDKILGRIATLEYHTHLGRKVPEFKDASIRELIENPYRIIYKIIHKNEVSIVRIYHSARLINFEMK